MNERTKKSLVFLPYGPKETMLQKFLLNVHVLFVLCFSWFDDEDTDIVFQEVMTLHICK